MRAPTTSLTRWSRSQVWPPTRLTGRGSKPTARAPPTSHWRKRSASSCPRNARSCGKWSKTSRCRFSRAWVLPRPLRQNKQASDDENGDDRRRDGAAQRQAAVADRLVEEIADGGAERPGQDERSPEQ